MIATTPNPTVAIRRASADDLPALVDLIRRRDEREHPATAVGKYLFNLDPQRIAAWLAMVDGRPAALNSIYLRDLWWGDGPVRTGYWAHLYVEPDCRKLMLYSQLVAAMLRAARELPLDVIYTATRRQQVAESHVKLGFRLLATLPVRMKPLRPFRLLAKHWGSPRFIEGASAPFDGIWRIGQKLRRHASQNAAPIEQLPWESPEVEAVVGLLNSADGNRVHMLWDLDTLRRRFAETIEGRPYTLFVARDPEHRNIVAAALVRIAERGPRAIRAAVLIDLVTAPGRTELASMLLGEIDRVANSNNTEVVLALDGAGAEFSSQLANWGYRTAPETYNLLVWPKAKVAPDAFAGQIENWRFTFADHDAF